MKEQNLYTRLLGYNYSDGLLGKQMHELNHHARRDGTRYPVEECRMNSVYRGEEVGWGVTKKMRYCGGRMVQALTRNTDLTLSAAGMRLSGG